MAPHPSSSPTLSLVDIDAPRLTLRRPCVLEGVGLHTGRRVRATVRPARGGLSFVLREAGVRIAPTPGAVDLSASLCTRLSSDGRPDAPGVMTVEHLLAALALVGVDDAEIEVDGGEIPILDGSAQPFLDALLAVGLERSGGPRQAFVPTAEIRFDEHPRGLRLTPPRERSAPRLDMNVAIDFPFIAAVGHQVLAIGIDCVLPLAAAPELTPARTFVEARHVPALRAAGLIRGGGRDNAIILHPEQVEASGGLRFPDECVRHKILDLVGDLALAGAPIIGALSATAPGHALTARFLRSAAAR